MTTNPPETLRPLVVPVNSAAYWRDLYEDEEPDSRRRVIAIPDDPEGLPRLVAPSPVA